MARRSNGRRPPDKETLKALFAMFEARDPVTYLAAVAAGELKPTSKMLQIVIDAAERGRHSDGERAAIAAAIDAARAKAAG